VLFLKLAGCQLKVSQAGSALTSTAVHAVAVAVPAPMRFHHAGSFRIKDLLLLWGECGVQGFGGVSAAVHEGVHL
jgi:hypothetical protein